MRGLLAAIALFAITLAGCGGNSSLTGGASSTGAPLISPAVTSGTARNACILVSAADLYSLALTAPGRPSSFTIGGYTTYSCSWGHVPGTELHLQFEPLDPAAASQVRHSLVGTGSVVPGLGDGARGQFGSVLAAVNFYKANTFVLMELLGPGAGRLKAAFISVAKNVAGRL